MSTVSINKFLSSINFKQVVYIQALGQKDWPNPAPQVCCEQRTALVFVDGTVLVSGQPLGRWPMAACWIFHVQIVKLARKRNGSFRWMPSIIWNLSQDRRMTPGSAARAA